MSPILFLGTDHDNFFHIRKLIAVIRPLGEQVVAGSDDNFGFRILSLVHILHYGPTEWVTKA